MGNIRVKFLILFVPLKYINRSNKELNEKLLFFFRRPKILKIEKKNNKQNKIYQRKLITSNSASPKRPENFPFLV